MAETSSHKNAKTRGLRSSRTEIPIRGNRRLDASTARIAREVERSGGEKSLAKAVRRLNTQTNKKKELVVLTVNLDKAKRVAEKIAKGKLTIKNLAGTQRRFVNSPLKKSLAQKIFGSNLYLRNKEIEFVPQTQWATLCAARQKISENSFCFVLERLYQAVRTHFIKKI